MCEIMGESEIMGGIVGGSGVDGVGSAGECGGRASAAGGGSVAGCGGSWVMLRARARAVARGPFACGGAA